MKKTLWLIVAVIIYCVCITGCKKKCPDLSENTVIERSNQWLIDSLKSQVKFRDQKISEYRDLINQSKKREQQVIIKYKTVYEKILSSSSSDQLAITKKLLIEHSRFPLKRD